MVSWKDAAHRNGCNSIRITVLAVFLGDGHLHTNGILISQKRHFASMLRAINTHTYIHRNLPPQLRTQITSSCTVLEPCTAVSPEKSERQKGTLMEKIVQCNLF